MGAVRNLPHPSAVSHSFPIFNVFPSRLFYFNVFPSRLFYPKPLNFTHFFQPAPRYAVERIFLWLISCSNYVVLERRDSRRRYFFCRFFFVAMILISLNSDPERFFRRFYSLYSSCFVFCRINFDFQFSNFLLFIRGTHQYCSHSLCSIFLRCTKSFCFYFRSFHLRTFHRHSVLLCSSCLHSIPFDPLYSYSRTFHFRSFYFLLASFVPLLLIPTLARLS